MCKNYMYIKLKKRKFDTDLYFDVNKLNFLCEIICTGKIIKFYIINRFSFDMERIPIYEYKTQKRMAK